MKYLPIGLDVRGRICIVVGGGRIGTRKAMNLLGAGCRLRWCPRIDELEAVSDLAGQGNSDG